MTVAAQNGDSPRVSINASLMNDVRSGETEAAGQRPVVIIGAGPAGLTAAYELARRGVRSVVLERDGIVGGLARTEEYKGYLFDIGGHRFFTKVSLVEKIWTGILGSDFLSRPRLSRIYYKKNSSITRSSR